jgi:hypothetical protein
MRAIGSKWVKSTNGKRRANDFTCLGFDYDRARGHVLADEERL